MSYTKIALIGNPNAGKTSLFNRLTKQNQKTGNFPGVTVDKKTGEYNYNGNTYSVLDLPGTYSLYAKSLDEQVVIDTLFKKEDPNFPDILLVILDQSSLKRNLLLFSQLLELNIPIVPVMNMVEEAEAKGMMLKQEEFTKEFGLKPISINARDGKGIEELKEAITTAKISARRLFKSTHPVIKDIRKEFSLWSDYIALQYAHQYQLSKHFSKQDVTRLDQITFTHSFNAWKEQKKETEQRYSEIDTVLANILDQKTTVVSIISDQFDKLMVHPVFGYLSFLGVLFIIFQLIFNLSAYPMDAIDAGIGWLSDTLKALIPQGHFNSLLTDGIIPGIGGVVIFIPQIAFLFAILTILEDSGYMSRVMFITDKFMRRFGLNGRSLIPLVSGVACAVPAVMAARSIESPKERLITILVTPFMSCSARLPVYTILISLIIPENASLGFFNVQGMVLMGLYLLGVITALLSAWITKFFIKEERKSYFILELPAYRKPNWRNVLFTMYDKSKTFTIEAGKVILVISMVLWGLASFGPGTAIADAETRIRAEAQNDQLNENQLSNRIKSEQLAVSYAGILGKSIEPVITPLGYDWKMGIALITSFAAREVFVGTISTLYSLGGDDENSTGLRDRLSRERRADGTLMYNTASVLSLLVFYAFAMQCMSTLAIVYKETKHIKWPLIQLFMMTGLAYISALIVYQTLK